MSFFDFRAFDADEVIEGLFLGSMDASNKLEELKSRKTKRILVAAADLKVHYPKEFDYLQIIVEDSFNQNLLSVLPICMDFIDEIMNEEKRKKNADDPASILVHCAAGISRSTTVVIAYIMKTKNLNFEEAWKLVKEKRRWACPNSGFQYQLKLWHEMGFKLDYNHKDFKQLMEEYKTPVVEFWSNGEKKSLN